MKKTLAFTLVELLVVVAILSLLTALLIPAVSRGMAAAGEAACASNLKQLQIAYDMYLSDHQGRFFPWRENRPDGVLWYWGLESSPGATAPSSRKIDRGMARLAPYIGEGSVETCPAFPYKSSAFKQKFDAKTYGYGINVYLLSDTPENAAPHGLTSVDKVTQPASTLAWGDAIQVNMFQAPASPQHPMLEEWYYLANRSGELPTYHFRHNTRLNAAFLDGSVRSFAPDRLLPYCDGRVGYLEKKGIGYLLLTQK